VGCQPAKIAKAKLGRVQTSKADHTGAKFVLVRTFGFDEVLQRARGRRALLDDHPAALQKGARVDAKTSDFIAAEIVDLLKWYLFGRVEKADRNPHIAQITPKLGINS